MKIEKYKSEEFFTEFFGDGKALLYPIRRKK